MSELRGVKGSSFWPKKDLYLSRQEFAEMFEIQASGKNVEEWAMRKYDLTPYTEYRIIVEDTHL